MVWSAYWLLRVTRNSGGWVHVRWRNRMDSECGRGLCRAACGNAKGQMLAARHRRRAQRAVRHVRALTLLRHHGSGTPRRF
eukprot:15200656-Alexandrium_andersonii.AAC.1